jgi:hypothetical protein
MFTWNSDFHENIFEGINQLFCKYEDPRYKENQVGENLKDVLEMTMFVSDRVRLYP